MTNWNCRLVDHNGDSVVLPWRAVEAPNAEKAAEIYCGVDAWDHISWSDGCVGVVEVEEMGGERGVQRMSVSAYHSVEFSAEPDDEESDDRTNASDSSNASVNQNSSPAAASSAGGGE